MSPLAIRHFLVAAGLIAEPREILQAAGTSTLLRARSPNHPRPARRPRACERALRSVAGELLGVAERATIQLYQGDFTPAGLDIRIATTDGRRLGDFLDNPHTQDPDP